MRFVKTMGAIGLVFGAGLLLAVAARAQGAADYVLAFAPSGKWTLTPSLHQAREEHTATLLDSGNVLVAGGAVNGVPIISSELYNPATGKWAGTGNLNVDRADAGAVLLLTVA
jgi:hypothetical protein